MTRKAPVIALCAAACSGYGGSGSGGESLAPPGTGDSEAEISDAADADAVSSNRNATFEIADRDVFHTTAWTDPSSGEDYALLERWSLTPEQRWAKAIFRDANADGQRVHALAPTTDGRVFVLGEYQRRFTLGGITLLGDESATGTREDYFMAEFDQRGDLTSLLSLGGTHDVRYMNPRWTSRGLLLTVQPLTGNPASSDSPAYVALWRPSAP